MTPDQQRRLEAKQANEAIKLAATLLNNLAVGLFVGGLVAPTAAGRSLGYDWYVGLLIASAGLHIAGRILLTGLKLEE